MFQMFTLHGKLLNSGSADYYFFFLLKATKRSIFKVGIL